MPDPSRRGAEVRRAFAPSGVLRAAINLGNPVLAHSHTSKEKPAGVTVDLARRLGGLLQLPVELFCFDTPARAGDAIASGEADVGFLAIDPTRAESLRFTRPYVQIEGCYLVRYTSPVQGADEVDRPGTNIVVGVGSAYALFLARELRAARLVHVPTSEEVVNALVSNPELHVAAGVRQQLEADMATVDGVRLLPDAFMAIRQGMVVPRHCGAGVLAFLDDFLRDAHESGFLGASFRLHGITGAALLSNPAP
jgi:polar amino acid transport system substrate-binding protein